ncbi:O-antigen ligase family protein [Porphyromonadaceae sp. NP-X]|nr:O-antigen ligase family protein [Porphyromonadaceae sp. NP-X]
MRKNKILTYAAAFVVTVSTFTLIQGYFPFFMKSWIFLGILAVLISLLYPKIYLEKSIIWLMIYSLVLIFNFLSGDEVYVLGFSLTEITFYFIPASLFLIYMRNNDLNNVRTIAIVSILIIIITSIFTFKNAIDNPGIVRSIVRAQTSEDYTYIIEQYRKGIASYGMPHAFPFIVPPFIYVLKNKNFSFKLRIFALLMVMIGGLMVFYTESTGALVVLLFSIIMSLIIIESSLKKNIMRLVSLGVIALLFLNTQTLISVLDFFGAETETMTYYGKIEDTMTMLETGKTVGQIANRQELHNMSLTAFLNHPLLGTNKGSNIGGHAYFMDRAGLLGLVGFIPLFLFFYYQIKTTYKNLSDSIRMYYLIGVVACIILGFQKNMAGFEYWLYLFFLLPGLCMLVDKEYSYKYK